MAAGEDTAASATFRASENRASSPPEAILAKPPKAAPSTVATSKAMRSSPPAVPLSSSSFSSATRNLAWPSFSGVNSPATALSSFFAAPSRDLDNLRAAVRYASRAALTLLSAFLIWLPPLVRASCLAA